MFFPDAFMMLVNFANNAATFLKNLIMPLWNKAQHQMPAAPSAMMMPIRIIGILIG